jgi:excisionase family DNA binding protein
MGRPTRRAQASSGQLRFPVTPSGYGESRNDALLLTVKEAAALMRIGRDTTYSLVAQRRIPCVKLGKQIRIPRKALIAHLEKEALQQALEFDKDGAER